MNDTTPIPETVSKKTRGRPRNAAVAEYMKSGLLSFVESSGHTSRSFTNAVYRQRGLSFLSDNNLTEKVLGSGFLKWEKPPKGWSTILVEIGRFSEKYSNAAEKIEELMNKEGSLTQKAAQLKGYRITRKPKTPQQVASHALGLAIRLEREYPGTEAITLGEGFREALKSVDLAAIANWHENKKRHRASPEIHIDPIPGKVTNEDDIGVDVGRFATNAINEIPPGERLTGIKNIMAEVDKLACDEEQFLPSMMAIFYGMVEKVTTEKLKAGRRRHASYAEWMYQLSNMLMASIPDKNPNLYYAYYCMNFALENRQLILPDGEMEPILKEKPRS